MSISRSMNEHSVDRVLVGRVVGAHGIKGTIRVHPLTDYPERFLEMERLYLERTGKPPKPPKVLEVERVSSHEGKGQFLFTVRGVESREAAEALTGCLVTVAPEERVSLPEGEYWIDSLIGLEVRGRDASEDESVTPQLENLENLSDLGVIEDVMPTGSNDVYLVRTPDGAAKLIPAIADVVRKIDIEAGVMIVVLPEGLWD